PEVDEAVGETCERPAAEVLEREAGGGLEAGREHGALERCLGGRVGPEHEVERLLGDAAGLRGHGGSSVREPKPQTVAAFASLLRQYSVRNARTGHGVASALASPAHPAP